MSMLEKNGIDAEYQYEICKSKLTDEAQRMLENEAHEHFGNWRKFVLFDGEKISEESGSPSPNRPQKTWWRRWVEKRHPDSKIITKNEETESS